MSEPYETWLGRCTVRVWGSTRYLETVFPDGTKVSAAPDFERDGPTAERLGYGGDEAGIVKLWLHHDVGHTFIAQKVGCKWSPTLYAVAHGEAEDILQFVEHEERVVMAFQQYLNGGPVPEGDHVDWAALKEEFEGLIREVMDGLERSGTKVFDRVPAGA